MKIENANTPDVTMIVTERDALKEAIASKVERIKIRGELAKEVLFSFRYGIAVQIASGLIMLFPSAFYKKMAAFWGKEAAVALVVASLCILAAFAVLSYRHSLVHKLRSYKAAGNNISRGEQHFEEELYIDIMLKKKPKKKAVNNISCCD